MKNLRTVIPATVLSVILFTPGSVPALVFREKPPCYFYTCIFPLGYCMNAISQWKSGRETVTVMIHSQEVNFKKTGLLYYDIRILDEKRMVESGEMVRDYEFPVGERIIRFSAGEIKFYKSGVVMSGTLARRNDFVVGTVKVSLGSKVGFHENGALSFGYLRARTG